MVELNRFRRKEYNNSNRQVEIIRAIKIPFHICSSSRYQVLIKLPCNNDACAITQFLLFRIHTTVLITTTSHLRVCPSNGWYIPRYHGILSYSDFYILI